MSILSAAIGIASSVVGLMGDDEDHEAQRRQWQQNYANALASGMEDQKAIQMRLIQEQDAKAQKDHLTKIEGAEIWAEAEASAAEAGVSGVSLNNILAGISRKIAAKRSADEINYQNTAMQLTAQMEATNTNIANRINSVQRPGAPPNPLGYALKAAGTVLANVETKQAKQTKQAKADKVKRLSKLSIQM